MVCYQFERRETEADRHPSPSPRMGTANDPPPPSLLTPSYRPSLSLLTLLPSSLWRPRRTGRAKGENVSAKRNNKKQFVGKARRQDEPFCVVLRQEINCVVCCLGEGGRGGGRPIMGYCLKGRRYSTDPSTPFCTYPRPTHPTAGTRDKLHEKDSKARKEIQAVTSPPKPPASKAA